MEGEAARFIFQGAEITISVVKDAAKGLVQVIAFLRALAQKEKLYGETGKKGILRAGEQLVIGTIPKDKMPDFMQKAKDYGLPYHSVFAKEKNAYDVLIKRSDMEKLNIIIERIGIAKDDMNIQDFTVEDVRGSVKEKLEGLEKKTQKAEADRQWNRQEISKMETSEIQQAVKDINTNNPAGYTPEKWRAYLEMQSVLYDYSARNKERIYDQRPEATLVMSRTAWNNIGRTLSPDAEGIMIKMPELKDNARTGKFVDAPVYDIADTVGSEVNIRSLFMQTGDSELKKMVEQMKAGHNVTVAAELDGDARFDPEKNVILLREGLSETQQFQALVRESTYAKCFSEQGSAYNRDKNRFRAESVTYAMSTKCGIDASKYSFDYIGDLKETEGLLKNEKSLVLKDIAVKSTEIKNILEKSKTVGRER